MLHITLDPCKLGINLLLLQPLLYTMSCRRSLWKLGQ
ncbi:BgTH12-03826 [Blumeria graminis f. sp. triticale]|uniref:BgTH12-03826 n=1 Tax=Blumeria graminis f. sp. triticale TaxID=1689686 RepID=A0A9W4GCT7_BLUGR|nr:BgTH12-03826 [Blumeria graminis f. sp. triticale]